MQKKFLDKFKIFLQAVRLPFITASSLPFIFGSLLVKGHFNLLNFALGLVCVIAVHLSANLINDYADSKSGADWQDKQFYKFFGGSKLIQQKVLSERFYLNLAIACLSLSGIAILLLALILKNLSIIFFYLLIIFLAWSYSARPLRLSYRRAGEIIIFMLFGQAAVMGGYFIQTKIFPTLQGFILSLPFGFLVTAILFANELPDFPEDEKAAKSTWIALTGQKNAFLLYSLLIFLAYFSIWIGFLLRYLSVTALFSFICIPAAFKAARILKTNFNDKQKLVESSKLTIAIHNLTSIVLILSLPR